MYRIKNTAEDRSKHLKHRTATKFEIEPSLGGNRIRLGSYLDISDEHYARVKPTVDEWVKNGTVDVFPVLPDGTDVRKFAKEPELSAEGLRLDGPTLEKWTSAGYFEENYPPQGYAEVFSPGLVVLRRAQEAAQEAAKKAAEIIKESVALPSVTEQILPATSVEEPLVPPPVIEELPSTATTSTSTGVPKGKKKLI